MDIQIKLYKVFDKTKDNTLSKLYDFLGSKACEIINKNIIGIYYDYNKNSIANINSILEELDCEEVVIVNEKFYNLIINALNESCKIQNIILRDRIQDVEESIREYINNLFHVNERDCTEDIDNLIYELDWVSTEEKIDIDYIDIRIPINSEMVLIKVNRRGEILGNSSSLNIIKELINKSL